MNLAIETVYAELTERCHAAAGLEGVPENATAQWRDRGGRSSLYFKWRDGNRVAGRYAGPENDHTKAVAERHRRRRDDGVERRDMVRMLAGARMPQPDARTGKVLATLADANGPSWRAPLEAAIRLLPAEAQGALQLDALNAEAKE